MKKNVIITLLLVVFSVSTVSAQGFLKKAGDALKKSVTTETKEETKQAEYVGPLDFKIETTRVIGNQILISGKMKASEDFRMMLSNIVAITPDGDTYEVGDLWWGGEKTTRLAFDNKLAAGINYSIDIAIDVKGKPVREITSLTLTVFNHTAQKRFTIPIQNLVVPYPIDPNLANPSVIEIDKDVYMRWTRAEETHESLTLYFVVENKGNKDVKIQFSAYTNKINIIDTDGNAYEATTTLKDRIDFPAGTPVAGNITLDKPLKVSNIALLEFSSRYYTYKLRKIVVPTN